MYSTDNLVEKKKQSRCLLISLAVGCILMFVIGILIGRFATCPDEPQKEVNSRGLSEALVRDADPTIAKELMDSISSNRIRENLRMLTEKPHLAGTVENYNLALKIKTFWEEVGVDHVTLTPYRVLLSYPDKDDLNYVELLENNVTKYKSNLTEPILTSEENKPGVVPPFNAYSAHGDIYGDVVYVNYGRVEDYIYLEQNKNINISGKIVIARYGKIFRGDKVHLAELRGAVAVILFSDPEDVTNGDINQVYPKDWWLPPSGTQRGTVFIGDGDPLTAGYPAIETAYRKLSPDEYLPAIPCHPIGYGIAIHIMRNLGGEVVPQTWQGGMNVTYRFGDGFQTTGWQAHVKVSTRNENVTIYNTIGVIRGSIEPDRYVLIGNHRDAWVFGALDPSSGTAIMMEISKAIGELVKSGRWRPRRSIIFCSWGAEEYGLVGSTEWVEHYTKSLGARAIAYLNVDIAVQGNYTFRALGTPMIFKSLYDATQKVPNPNATEVSEGRTTVYDTWKMATPSEEFDRPRITLPGSGSDYATFRDRLGIPVVDLRYTWDPRFKLSAYPMYHSAYETFYLVDEIMDRGFNYHKAIGQIWTEMARDLADSLIIPFNVSDYSNVITSIGKTFMDSFRDIMNNASIDTALLDQAISNFTSAVQEFENQIKEANLNDPFVVRRINDQLMQLDRAFLDPAGLPGRHLKRHILFAESTVDNYAGSRFPGLSDAITKIKLGEDVTNQWDVVKKHYSVILFTFQSASSTLKDVSNFMFSF